MLPVTVMDHNVKIRDVQALNQMDELVSRRDVWSNLLDFNLF